MFVRLGVSDPFDVNHALVTSPWKWLNSMYGLTTFRLIAALYTLVVLCVDIAWASLKEHTASSWFSYFTHLTYIGLCAYFFAAGVQTFFFAKSGKREYPLQKWPRVLQLLHILLLSSVVTLPIVVTIIYWALLASPSTFATPFNSWSSISMHALNTVFALLEICLTNIPLLPWLTLIPNLFILFCYACLAYVSHETLGFYVYDFLDPGKQKAKLAAYILGIAVAECVAFCFTQGLIALRRRISGQQATHREDTVIQMNNSISGSSSWEEDKAPKENDADRV